MANKVSKLFVHKRAIRSMKVIEKLQDPKIISIYKNA